MNQSEDLKERVRVLQQELERKRLLLQKAEKKPKSACIRRSSTLLPVVEETSSEVSVPECSGEFLCDENVTVTTANFINIKSLESSESSMQEDRHSPNVVTTRFSHSPERRHRGSRYNSSISRSPSMKHSRGEYHNDPYRSSNSRSKNHPSRRRYKSPEINGRDFNLGKHDRSTISSNSPRRRFRHSPAPPNNPNSSYRRFERDRMTRDNRRFRAFSPALNRNPHHRLGINSSKVSGSRFNRVHHQRRF
ncbi:unnamed protein product [Heterobilharzia americana]|nr:unnamed protein product [Heterobilharzia americana]